MDPSRNPQFPPLPNYDKPCPCLNLDNNQNKLAYTLSRPMWLFEPCFDQNRNQSCGGGSSNPCDDAVRRAMAKIVPGSCNNNCPMLGSVSGVSSSPCMSNTPCAGVSNNQSHFGPFNPDPGFINYNSSVPPNSTANNNGANMPSCGPGQFSTYGGINPQGGSGSGQFPSGGTNFQGQFPSGGTNFQGQFPPGGTYSQGGSPGQFPSGGINSQGGSGPGQFSTAGTNYPGGGPVQFNSGGNPGQIPSGGTNSQGAPGQFPPGGTNSQGAPGQFPLEGINSQGAPGQFPLGGINSQGAPGQFPPGGINSQGAPGQFPPGGTNSQGAPGQFPLGGTNSQGAPGQFPPGGTNSQTGSPGQFPSGGTNSQKDGPDQFSPTRENLQGGSAPGQHPFSGGNTGGNQPNNSGNYHSRPDIPANQQPIGGPEKNLYPNQPTNGSNNGGQNAYPGGTGQFSPGGNINGSQPGNASNFSSEPAIRGNQQTPDKNINSGNLTNAPSTGTGGSNVNGPKQFPGTGTNFGANDPNAGNNFSNNGGQPGNQQVTGFPDKNPNSTNDTRTHPLAQPTNGFPNGGNQGPYSNQPYKPLETVDRAAGSDTDVRNYSFPNALNTNAPTAVNPVSHQPGTDNRYNPSPNSSTPPNIHPDSGNQQPGSNLLPGQNPNLTGPQSVQPKTQEIGGLQPGTIPGIFHQSSVPGGVGSNNGINSHQPNGKPVNEVPPYRPTPIIDSPNARRGNSVDRACGPDADNRKFGQPDGHETTNKGSPQGSKNLQDLCVRPVGIPGVAGGRKQGKPGKIKQSGTKGPPRGVCPSASDGVNLPNGNANPFRPNKPRNSYPGTGNPLLPRCSRLGTPPPRQRKCLPEENFRVQQVVKPKRRSSTEITGNGTCKPENEKRPTCRSVSGDHSQPPIDQSVKPKVKAFPNTRKASINTANPNPVNQEAGKTLKSGSQGAAPYRCFPVSDSPNWPNLHKGSNKGPTSKERRVCSATQVKNPARSKKKCQGERMPSEDLLQPFDPAFLDAIRKTKNYKNPACLPGSPYINYQKLFGGEYDYALGYPTNFSSPYGSGKGNHKRNKINQGQSRCSSARPGTGTRKCQNSPPQDDNFSHLNRKCRTSRSLYDNDFVTVPIRPFTVVASTGNRNTRKCTPAFSSQREEIARAVQRLKINPEKIMKKYRSEKENEEKWSKIRRKEQERCMREYLEEYEAELEERISRARGSKNQNCQNNDLEPIIEQPSGSTLKKCTDNSTNTSNKHRGQCVQSDTDDPFSSDRHLKHRHCLDGADVESPSQVTEALRELRAQFDHYLERFADTIRAVRRADVDELCPPFDLSIGHPLGISRPRPLDRGTRPQPGAFRRNSPDQDGNLCQFGYPSRSIPSRTCAREPERACTPPPPSSCYDTCPPYRIYSVDQLNPSTCRNCRFNMQEYEDQRNRSKEKELDNVDADMDWLRSSGIFSIARPTSRQRFVSSPTSSTVSTRMDSAESLQTVNDEHGFSMRSVNELLAKLTSSNALAPNPLEILEENVPELKNEDGKPVVNQKDDLNENIPDDSKILFDRISTAINSSDEKLVLQNQPDIKEVSTLSDKNPEVEISKKAENLIEVLKDSSEHEVRVDTQSPLDIPDILDASHYNSIELKTVQDIESPTIKSYNEENKYENDEDIIADVVSELLECADIISEGKLLYSESPDVQKFDSTNIESSIQPGRRRVELPVQEILAVAVESTASHPDPSQEILSNETELEEPMPLASVSSEYLLPPPHFIVKFNEELPTLVSALRKPHKSEDGESSVSVSIASSKSRDRNVRFDPVLQTQVFEKDDPTPQYLDSSSESEFSDAEFLESANANASPLEAPQAGRSLSVTNFFGNLHGPGATGALGYYSALRRTPESISKAVGRHSTKLLVGLRGSSSSDTAIHDLGKTPNFTTNENLSLESIADKLKTEEEAEEKLENIIQRWNEKRTSASSYNDSTTQ